MNQAEKNKSVIIGVSLWGMVKALFVDCFDTLVEAIGSVNESLEKAPGVTESYIIMEAEDVFRKIDRHTTFKKNRVALWKSMTKLLPHYNYIPVAIRNMPYQRRAY